MRNYQNYTVLHNGEQYCTGNIYLYLLPFISQFLKLIVSVDPHHLYTNFFTNVRVFIQLIKLDVLNILEYIRVYTYLSFFRFSEQSVQTNHYEALAVTTSFVEYFGYYILLNVNNQDLINALLREQVLILSIYSKKYNCTNGAFTLK